MAIKKVFDCLKEEGRVTMVLIAETESYVNVCDENRVVILL